MLLIRRLYDTGVAMRWWMLVGWLGVASISEAAEFDLLFENATVVDGTGAPAFVADVAIADGRIAALSAIGALDRGAADEVVDVAGLVLAPGFIDVHSHADAALADPATAGVTGFLHQGVTTAVFGVDGSLEHSRLRQYIDIAADGGAGINFMAYAGHNSIRREVMGMARRAPNAEELAAMRELVDEAMRMGAVGLSSGLMYQPGTFAETAELIALAQVVQPYGGRYDSHVRDPANNLLASHAEAMDIARAAGVAAHPAHVKAVGGKNFELGAALVQLFQSRVDAGQDVTVDLYPYDGAATQSMVSLLRPGDDPDGLALHQRIRALLAGTAPASAVPQVIADLVTYLTALEPGSDAYEQAVINTERPPSGDYSWIATVGYQSMRVVVSDDPDDVGHMLPALAARRGVEPFELVRRLVANQGGTPYVTLGAIREADVRHMLTQPWAMVASDGEELSPSHPRGRGTFPRVLGRYVREWGVLTLPEAIHKITGLPARYLNLVDRGRVRPGYVADLTIFDPETIIDHATWADPTQYAEGVMHVLIAGQFAVRNTVVGTDRWGRFIRFDGKPAQ